MEKRNTVDEMDRTILQTLFSYERLTPVQLWYELGEDDAVKEKLTEEEVFNRLESLMQRGLVEKAIRPGANREVESLFYRVTTTAVEARDGRKKREGKRSRR